MALPEDLLEQAQHLALREPKRPKARESPARSFYRVLCAVPFADHGITKNWKRASQRNLLGRAFDHGPMKKACEKKRAEINTYLRTEPNPCDRLTIATHLHTVTGTFIQLQQQRHSADYDSSKRWSRHEVQVHLGAVRAAFRSWKAIRNEDAAQEFLVTLLLKDR